MLRNVLLAGLLASASAFSAAPMTPALRSATVPSSRPQCTQLKMIDETTALVAAPGLIAAGALLRDSFFPVTSVAAPAAAPAPAATSVSSTEMLNLARTNFNRWNDSLQTKNPAAVAALYCDNGLSFLPTVSPQHIKNTGNTQDYFVEFVKKNPFGTITDDSVQTFDNGDAYLHSGMYTFELGDAGARTPVQARFSYVWKKEGGSWKISHHHSSVRPAAPDMLQLARDNFKRWNDSLQTKDPKQVAALYCAEGLSFLPTVSPQHIKNTGNTQDYFVEFVKKNPFGTITDDSVQVYADDAYLHSGMYTFELGDEGARTPVEARFSYVWKKEGGSWKISHHHSSVRPEGAVKKEAVPA